MAVLTDEARKISALPAQAAIFDPLNIKYIYRNHGIHVPRSYFVHTSFLYYLYRKGSISIRLIVKLHIDFT